MNKPYCALKKIILLWQKHVFPLLLITAASSFHALLSQKLLFLFGTYVRTVWPLISSILTIQMTCFDFPYWKKYIFSLRDLAKKLRIFKRSQVVQIIPITFDSSQSSQYWHACERLYLEYCHHRQRLPLYSDIEQNPHSKIAPSRGYLLAWKKSMYHGKMAFSSYFF